MVVWSGWEAALKRTALRKWGEKRSGI